MSLGGARQALDPSGGLLAQLLLRGSPCPSLSESGDLVIYGRLVCTWKTLGSGRTELETFLHPVYGPWEGCLTSRCLSFPTWRAGTITLFTCGRYEDYSESRAPGLGGPCPGVGYFCHQP